jgi:S-adenosyl methyltransferase
VSDCGAGAALTVSGMQQLIPSAHDRPLADRLRRPADRQPQPADAKTPVADPAPPASSMLSEPDPLPGLRSDFPAFRIWREDVRGRVRYIACRQRRDLHPYAIVTDDPEELRAALAPAGETGLVPLSTETPSIARVYNLLLGGKDHYAADRAMVGPVLDRFPEVTPITRANRAFQALAIRYAAGQGIAQFIDLGAGLPITPSTHETAREIVPAARVAYVDRDQMVLAHARARLAADDQIAVVAADIRDPAGVLADPALTSVIDLAKPVAVLLAAVLHFLPACEADAAVTAFRAAMAPGSYLVISAGTCTGTDPELIRSLQTAYRGTAQVTGRTEAEILAWFDGLTLAAPGLTEVWAWRPDCPPHLVRPPSARVRFLAGVACKPAPNRRWLP